MTSTTPPESGTMLEALISDLSAEADRIRGEAKEIKLLVEQNRGELDKLRQRQSAVSARLKQLQPAFETVPREDIRATYETALDTQQRLFNMGGEIERLQSKMALYEEYGKTIGRVLEVLRNNEPEAAPSGPAPKPVLIRLVEAQEEERQRLSRKMHDGPAQVLTSFILQAEIASRLLDNDPQKAKEELTSLKGSATSAFQQIRDFIYDLRPMMLDDLGLVPTSRRYLETLREKSGLDISFIFTGAERRIANHVEVILFRAIQQMVALARDVSAATRIKVSVDLDEKHVRCAAEWNGKELRVDPQAGGDPYELAALRERIGLLRGRFEIVSDAENGSRATLEVPLEE
jgi:two-component system sensor histidine kinase DegS